MSIFREAPLPDGSPGPVSMRRVLALYFAALSAPLGILAIPRGNWTAFIPCGIAVSACLLLLFFTTWADVKSIVEAAKGVK